MTTAVQQKYFVGCIYKYVAINYVPPNIESPIQLRGMCMCTYFLSMCTVLYTVGVHIHKYFYDVYTRVHFP